VVRPLRRSDAAAWVALRERNAARLLRWEAIPPGVVLPHPLGRTAFFALLKSLRAEARAGRGVAFGIEYDGVLVGQLTVSAIQRGAALTATLGYWVDEGVAGRGITPSAVAMVVDRCFTALGLHRVEVDVQPTNDASRRVVQKLGFQREGVRRRLLHVDGAWRDHELWSLTFEEAAGGVGARYRRLRDSGQLETGQLGSGGGDESTKNSDTP
jgi:ribosomal-protein-alanine N-acetyltransferase